MKYNTKKITGIGLLSAIVAVLQILSLTLARAGVFSVTLALIPIVVGSAVYDWRAGGWLGLVFGVTALLDAGPFFAVSIPATIAVVLIKGIACGIAAGLVYVLLRKCNDYVRVAAAAVVCPVVNTGVFLLGCRLFFYDALTRWGADYASFWAYAVFGLVGVNFLIELAVNAILAPVVLRLIRVGKRGH